MRKRKMKSPLDRITLATDYLMRAQRLRNPKRIEAAKQKLARRCEEFVAVSSLSEFLNLSTAGSTPARPTPPAGLVQAAASID